MITITTNQQLMEPIYNKLAFEWIKDDPDEEAHKEPILIGKVIANILYNQEMNKARAYKLANEFVSQDKIELKAEDVVYIKDLVEKSKVPARYAGQILDILEEKEIKEKKK